MKTRIISNYQQQRHLTPRGLDYLLGGRLFANCPSPRDALRRGELMMRSAKLIGRVENPGAASQYDSRDALFADQYKIELDQLDALAATVVGGSLSSRVEDNYATSFGPLDWTDWAIRFGGPKATAIGLWKVRGRSTDWNKHHCSAKTMASLIDEQRMPEGGPCTINLSDRYGYYDFTVGGMAMVDHAVSIFSRSPLYLPHRTEPIHLPLHLALAAGIPEYVAHITIGLSREGGLLMIHPMDMIPKPRAVSRVTMPGHRPVYVPVRREVSFDSTVDQIDVVFESEGIRADGVAQRTVDHALRLRI